MKKKKIKLGDVCQIALPDGHYAYGRIFRDACIGIYREVSTMPKRVPIKEDYQFIVGIYQDILKSGEWEIVDHRPFDTESNSWPPPMFVIDKISGKYNIYHKGEIFEATEDKCSGMEEAAVWEAEHIIDRIMGKTKWHKR